MVKSNTNSMFHGTSNFATPTENSACEWGRYSSWRDPLISSKLNMQGSKGTMLSSPKSKSYKPNHCFMLENILR